MTDTTTASLNGLDLQQMTETVGLLKATPELAKFRFRASNRWIDGGESRSTIKGFYGAGAEDESRTEPFVITADVPPALLGNNEGANPLEFLLHSLATCVTTTTVLHASARGIRIDELSTELEGDIDLQGLLALDPDATIGYEQIEMRVRIKADCTDEELDDLLGFAECHSPICSMVSRSVPVVLTRVKD
ncbi:MAG: putative OsmC-like protein [Phycisphaerales bacterium]|jgi:uncharacterized OsmC-like protein